MRRLFLIPLVAIAGPMSAQKAKGSPAPIAPPAAIAAIRESDLRRDMFAFAGDGMRGREAGTIDEMRASMWVADQMRAIGLKPKGEDGGYFQWWNMRRRRISGVSSSVSVGGRSLALWSDITPASDVAADLSAPTLFIGDGRDTTIDLHGKVAVATLVPSTVPLRTTTNTYEYRYARQAISSQGAALIRRGAAAVILVADSIGDLAYRGIGAIQRRGTYDVPGGAPRSPPPAPAAVQTGNAAVAPAAPQPRSAPVLFVRRAALTELRQDGQVVDLRIRLETFDTPSVNIIGVVEGTDPKLRDEYVLFSSHQDHNGVLFPVDGDSINHGADDNGSVSVALLASARAFVRQPAKRSVLFVFHGAEERGLLGSRWHATHPVVPLNQIVAVLNGDMIGRNHPDSAALLGSQPPHRNSAALVQMALDANAVTGNFIIDSLWDRPSHPEGWYYRSDHVPYARLNVPALMFSTNLHADYHTPRDKPENIDYPKLARMTQWLYMTGWLVANAAARPTIDPGFKLER